MKYILVSNPNPPHNLRRFCPNYDQLPNFDSEESLIEYVIARNKEAGVIASDASCHIVDSLDLPDEYFFDAWEWEE